MELDTLLTSIDLLPLLLLRVVVGDILEHALLGNLLPLLLVELPLLGQGLSVGLELLVLFQSLGLLSLDLLLDSLYFGLRYAPLLQHLLLVQLR